MIHLVDSIGIPCKRQSVYEEVRNKLEPLLETLRQKDPHYEGHIQRACFYALEFGRLQTGDNVLKKIAEAMQGKTRRSDFACRYGGEEFVLILPDTDLAKALQAAKKMLAEIREYTFGTVARPFSLTISVGISSISNKDYSEWQEMLQDADQALYLAKNKGKDRVEFFLPQNAPEEALTHL